MEMIWFFLPMILFLGVVTSYEDFKTGLIRNKWVKLGIIYGVFVFAGMMSYIIFTGDVISSSYIVDYVSNMIISFIFGFFIWYTGFWSAGDAKLFFAYAVLIPLTAYAKGYVKYFPAFTLLVNTLLIVMIYLLVKMLKGTGKKEKISALKKSLELERVLTMVVSIFSLSWLVRTSLSFIGITLELFARVILLVILYYIFDKIFGEKTMYVYYGLFMLGLLVNFTEVFSLAYLQNFIRILIIFIFVKSFLFELSYGFFTNPVKMKDLKPGMVPAEYYYKKGGKYKKEKIDARSLYFRLRKGTEPIFNIKSLTRDDIKKLWKLEKEGKIGSSILVQETMPFALFMFIGALLTIIASGNFIVVLSRLFL